jgi:hypothetical protein
MEGNIDGFSYITDEDRSKVSVTGPDVLWVDCGYYVRLRMFPNIPSKAKDTLASKNCAGSDIAHWHKDTRSFNEAAPMSISTMMHCTVLVSSSFEPIIRGATVDGVEDIELVATVSSPFKESTKLKPRLVTEGSSILYLVFP